MRPLDPAVQPSHPEFDVNLTENVPVPMRDGVRLAPDVAIDRIAGGLGFTEGPVWRRGELLFSDIPNRRIARWRRLPEGPELTTFATGMSNGLTLDRQGRGGAAADRGRP